MKIYCLLLSFLAYTAIFAQGTFDLNAGDPLSEKHLASGALPTSPKNKPVIATERGCGERNRVAMSNYEWDLDGSLQYADSTKTFYDANGRPVETQNLHFNGTAWVPTTRDKSTYDDAGNRISLVLQNWVTDDWYNDFQHLWTYNSANQPITHAFQSWDGFTWNDYYFGVLEYDADGHLIMDADNTKRNFYTYNSAGNRLTLTRQLFIDSTWRNSVKFVSEYDGQENKLVAREQIWRESYWDDSDRYDYTYDLEGHVTSKSYQQLAEGMILFRSLVLYEYDVFGNKTLELSKKWVNNEWVDIERTIEVHVASDRPVLHLEQTFTPNGWLNKWQFLTDYDTTATGIISYAITQDWDSLGWRNTGRYTNIYNLDNNILWTKSEDWVNQNWTDAGYSVNTYTPDCLIQSHTVFLWRNNAWLKISDFQYYYEDLVGVHDYDALAGSFDLFPNPATEAITLRVKESQPFKVDVVGLQGKVFYSQKGAQKELNISNLEALPNGYYAVVLTNADGKIYSKPLVIKH